MQNCPHCARSIDDRASVCDHCGTSLIDPQFGDVFREIDVKLAEPAGDDAAAAAPHAGDANLNRSERFEPSASNELVDDVDVDLAALFDAEMAALQQSSHTHETEQRPLSIPEISLPAASAHDHEPAMAAPLHVEMSSPIEGPHEFDAELATPLHLEMESVAGAPHGLDGGVASPLPAEFGSISPENVLTSPLHTEMSPPEFVAADLPVPAPFSASGTRGKPAPATLRSGAGAPVGEAARRLPWKHWKIAAAGASLAVVGVVTVMGRPSIPPPVKGASVAPVPSSPPARLAHKAAAPVRHEEPVAAVSAPDARLPAVAAPDLADTAVTSAPKWVRTRQAGWATDGSKTVSFEVEAETEVRAWMKHVRPVLTVRCVGHQTEVFVVADSAMTIEPTPDQHTVRVGFDGQAPHDERWSDSTSKRELFAPDGNAMAQQLAHSHVMRFGFRPYGAAAASVDFDVHGFAAPLEALTKACRSTSGKLQVANRKK
jgi:hypothetical protein